jgi:potassium efflux system protein
MRLRIDVGIAYGSDVGKAMELIMQAAVENERILEDPRPVVTFEEFGDNSLGVSLRAFIASVETRLTTSTELRQVIYEKLNNAGITIAFPQRDVHLNTNTPLEIKVTHEQ